MSGLALVLDTTSEYYGDLDIQNNSLYMTTGTNAIRQHLQERLQLFFGEWFLDTSLGVPWFTEILIKNPSFTVVQEILKGEILDTPGVLELISFDFSYDNATRNLSLSFNCLTIEGSVDFSQIVELGV